MILRSGALLKKLSEDLKRGDTDIWSLDECHFYQHGTTLAMWIPSEDKDPTVLQYPTRKGISVFISMISNVFNAITFLKFLAVLIKRGKGKKMQIILDNARYHHARLLIQWPEDHKQSLFLDFLPPYSPKLNPIERVWKLLKKLRLDNQYFPNTNEVVKIIVRQFLLWLGENESLKTLCHME